MPYAGKSRSLPSGTRMRPIISSKRPGLRTIPLLQSARRASPTNRATQPSGSTPPGGLDDRYASLVGKAGCAKCEWVLAFHDYRADVGGRYGSEWNASFAFPVGSKLKGMFKLADYEADGFARDTTKLWMQLEWAH